MENSPFTPAKEVGPKLPEFDKKDKKDTKKSKAIGSLAFERPAVAEKPEQKQSLSKLFEQSQKEKSDSESEAEKDTKPELNEADTEFVVHEIAQERQAEVAAEPVSDNPEVQAAHTAAEEFYDRLVNEGLPLEMAAAETLAEIGPIEPIAENTETTNPDKDEAANTATPVIPLAGSTTPSRLPRATMPSLSQMQPNTAPFITSTTHITPNTAPTAAATRTEYVPYPARSHAFGDVLVGGIVGYLIGRRRGRIRTERKLLPVQKKLEREVTILKDTIADREHTIREAARERVREQRSTESIISVRSQKAAAETVIMDRRERPLAAPELHSRASFIPPSERIGHVVVAAEAGRTQSPEMQPSKPEAVDKHNAHRQVETLSRNELMVLSEKIIVEGSTLRNVYETHLISERGLRRLVTEYLRGGDVVRAFRRELIEREIDFERDPKLRDTVRRNLSGGGTSPTLTKLLQQAGVSPTQDTPQELALARAQHLREAKQQSRRASQRKVLDVSLVTIIAVLSAIIIVLLAHRI